MPFYTTLYIVIEIGVLSSLERIKFYNIIEKTHRGNAFVTHWSNVFRAPCRHFSAFASVGVVETPALSNELSEPPRPCPKYSNARLFSSICWLDCVHRKAQGILIFHPQVIVQWGNAIMKGSKTGQSSRIPWQLLQKLFLVIESSDIMCIYAFISNS